MRTTEQDLYIYVYLEVDVRDMSMLRYGVVFIARTKDCPNGKVSNDMRPCAKHNRYGRKKPDWCLAYYCTHTNLRTFPIRV